MEKIKIFISIVLGVAATFFDKYALIIIFVAAAVVMDWITGLVKAKISGEGINSSKATIGFWKKVALFLGLVFGFFLDYFVPYMLNYVNIDYPLKAMFGMIFGCYIVVNESISICENLHICSPNLLPKWIVNILTVAKEKIEKGGDSDE